MTLTRPGYLFLIGASLCIATLPIAGKFGLQQDVSVMALLISRAAVVLGVVLYFWRPELLRISRQGLWRCVELSLVNCFSMYFYLRTLNHLDASFSIILFSFIFIPFVILFNRLWGEKAESLDWGRFGLALIGVYLFVDPSGSFNWVGVGFGMLNATFYGIYTTLIERRLGKVAPMTILLYSMGMMALIFTAVGSVNGVEWPLSTDRLGWGTMLWFGLISTGLARVLLFSGIQLVGSKQAALFSPLDVVVALALSVVFLQESLSAVQLLATGLIILSVVLASWRPWELKTESSSANP